MQAIGFVNQKGGVGKTSSAAALIVSLRARGYRVTGLDIDPQGGLSLLVKDAHLVRARDLGKMLSQYASEDFCIIDSPPSLGPHITTTVDLSDGVVIPTLPEMLGLRGLVNLFDTIDKSKVIGLLIVGHRGLTLHHRAVLDKLQEMPYPILAVVPHSVTVSDSWVLSKGPYSYRPAMQMGIPQAYDRLTEGILKWLEKT